MKNLNSRISIKLKITRRKNEMYRIKIYWKGYAGQTIIVANDKEVINILNVISLVHANVKGLRIMLIDHSKDEVIYNGPLNEFVLIDLKYKMLDMKVFSENNGPFRGAFCASYELIKEFEAGK